MYCTLNLLLMAPLKPIYNLYGIITMCYLFDSKAKDLFSFYDCLTQKNVNINKELRYK